MASKPESTPGPASLEGSRVVIFGGSSGIGLQVAIASAKAGASNIHIIGRTREKLIAAEESIRATGGSECNVHVAQVDVTDEPKVQEYLAAFDDDSIDHLVTTPGGSAKLGNLVANKRTCADVRRQLDMKFFAQLAPVLAVGDKIKRGGSITMSSGVLSRRVGRGNDALAIANTAIECTVKCLANDYGFDGRRVRVNALSPGMTLTPVYADSEHMREYQAKVAESVPVQRNAIPQEERREEEEEEALGH
jgi:NAD(P)-dependent dehydrogenase (short-subunit alcohol dehydrogenase family)